MDDLYVMEIESTLKVEVEVTLSNGATMMVDLDTVEALANEFGYRLEPVTTVAEAVAAAMRDPMDEFIRGKGR